MQQQGEKIRIMVWILRVLTTNMIIVFLNSTHLLLCHGEPQEWERNGTLRANEEFRAPLPNSINVIMYIEFENNIFVDKTRHITKDY